MLFTSPLLYYCENMPLDDQYRFISRNWTWYRHDITGCSLCIQPFDEVKCIQNRELRRWLRWVNLNIILNMANDTYKTTEVKLRIATGLLNKIESLNAMEKMKIHDNLTFNVNKEINAVLDCNLPF